LIYAETIGSNTIETKTRKFERERGLLKLGGPKARGKRKKGKEFEEFLFVTKFTTG